MDRRKRVKLSKLLSFVLRHNPSLLNLSLDKERFSNIRIEELVLRIRKLRDYGWVNLEDIVKIVETDEKGRFEIRDGKIRATYGHSVDVRPKYEKVKLTPRLFHGTTKRAWERIREKGLLPMGRKFVHLTIKPEDALNVARRQGGNIILLEVDGNAMIREGLSIWKASDVIYLAERVPLKYIRVVTFGAMD
ncbi:MAG TPA: RNA 2'-phosphotransferase [Candidatus Korarchaeota archaeon]|nr:RNA 2'-phosphotransferase [Candidatus Korarchaeota archaeon]